MKRSFVFLVLLSLACSSAPPLLRQVTIEGIVTDDSGVPLPGVTVTTAGPQGQPFAAVTDHYGRYVLRVVGPSQYVLTLALAGMSQVEQRVRVRAERNPAPPVMLRLGTVAETITVTAHSPLSSKSIESLPTTRYARFQDHAFIPTRKQRATTFAIDVDRASYANVRRMLVDGIAPFPDAVRIEEMVNYFTWSYPQPEDDRPFAVVSEVAGCPWNAGSRLVRIGLQGRELDRGTMVPNNLVFLLDVSGSMSPEDRLPLIISAFEVLVNELRAEDRVAIVVYAGAAGVVLPSTSGADKKTILDALAQLEAGGSTAGGEGIELAYRIAKENFLPDGNNRVILATDGDFNVGVSGADALERLIETRRESGIYLSVLGVGTDNFQDAAMERLADKGNGNYAYLDSLREAEKVFRQELTGTLVTIARDVKVQVDFDPELVASYRQIGYENRAMANEDFENDAKDAGELGAGHSVTALFEVVPTPANARGRIGTIRVRYKQPRGLKVYAMRAEIVDDGKSAYEASADMQFAAAVAEFGMLLRDSPHKGTSSWEDVLQLARVARGADMDGRRGEFLTLAEKAKGLQ